MIDVEVEVTTNHRGYFMYRLCPNNDVTQDPDQDCFDQFVLNTEHGDPHLPITDWGLGWWNTRVQLPVGLTCDQCILQWTYTAGNDWGTCENGTQAVGCGPQETFRACADISIRAAVPVQLPVEPVRALPQPVGQKPAFNQPKLAKITPFL